MSRTISQRLDEIKAAAERLQKECDNWQASHDILSARYTTQATEVERLRETLKRVVKEARRQNSMKWKAVESFADYAELGVNACAAGPWHDASEMPPRCGRYLVLHGHGSEVNIWTLDHSWENPVGDRFPSVFPWAEIREPKEESDEQ